MVMTYLDIVKATLLKDKEAFGNIHENRAAAIVGAVFEELERQIADTKHGEFFLDGFGKFIIKLKKVNKDGEDIVQRRIIFKGANPRMRNMCTK